MKSPLPGMDPYLERFWNDVHGRLVAYVTDALNGDLPGRYRATLQKRVIVSDYDEPIDRTRYPDVGVVDNPAGVATLPQTKRITLRTPTVLRWADDSLTQYSVEIVDADSGDAVITAIEVLSRENKRPGDGRNQFRRKQAEYRDAGVNRVDVDLLRGGRRAFAFPENLITPDLIKPYYVVVQRGDHPGEAEVTAIDLREPLPELGVPLRPGEADVPLALQPLLDRVYANGRFPIRYDAPCDPPLTAADAAWAGALR